jgi:hypothetical protein
MVGTGGDKSRCKAAASARDSGPVAACPHLPDGKILFYGVNKTGKNIHEKIS